MAAVAPLVMSAAMFVMTQSPFALVFAVLSPLVVLGSLVDGRLVRRRRLRAERRRFVEECRETQREIDTAHARERAERDAVAPGGRRARIGWDTAAPPVVVLGRGRAPSGLRLDGLSSTRGQDEVTVALRELGERATVLQDAPLTVAAGSGVGIVGQGVVAIALARSLVLQLAAGCPPDQWRVACVEEWLVGIGYAECVAVPGEFARFAGPDGDIRVAVAPHEEALPGGFDTVIHLDRGGARIPGVPGGLRPELVTREQAIGWAVRAGDLARRESRVRGPAALPARVRLDSLPEVPGELRAVLGLGAAGPLAVDLVGQGPHAFIAGTTGSGKSELLLAWLLGLLATAPPSRVALLLLDFKGGATFRPLEGLPHVAGLVTDLDGPGTVTRAVDGVTAELRRRERELARLGLRAIDEPGHDLPRLLIVVDEYAALVAGAPGLQAVFADVAARGRALGVHLVLATQRPGGVVRDAVLANIGLRVCLRVTNRADSVAVIGTDEATAPAGPGRAWVLLDGEVTAIQSAIADADDLAAVRARWATHDRARAVWCDLLPAVLTLDAVPPTAFGLIDRPIEQEQVPADASGVTSVLVVGAAGSGRTSALAALAAGVRVVRVPVAPEDAWEVLVALGASPVARLVVLDDLDVLLAAVPADHERAVQALLVGLLRGAGGVRHRVLAAVQRVGPSVQGLAALVEERLVLRTPSRQEHLLAGGDVALFDPGAGPGSGTWRGERVQVVSGRGLDELPWPAAERYRPPADLLVVAGGDAPAIAGATRLGSVAERIPEHGVLVGAPEEWQAHWARLPHLLRERPFLFLDCTVADLRAVARVRGLPPLLVPGLGSGWLHDPGRGVLRVVLETIESAGDSPLDR